MNRFRTFAQFWWDFVVGDDWRVAAGLAVALVTVGVLERQDVSAWWVLPVAVPLLLYASLRRGIKKS
jgi:hypothetical protein